MTRLCNAILGKSIEKQGNFGKKANNKKPLNFADQRLTISRYDEKLPCTAYGNRTRDSSVKGMRLNPLTNAALTLKPLRLPPFRACKDID